MLELRLPGDFSDYSWEIESKGLLLNIEISDGKSTVFVDFYDPVRLAQAIADEVRLDGRAILRRTVVVERLTEELMRRAVEELSSSIFE